MGLGNLIKKAIDKADKFGESSRARRLKYLKEQEKLIDVENRIVSKVNKIEKNKARIRKYRGQDNQQLGTFGSDVLGLGNMGQQPQPRHKPKHKKKKKGKGKQIIIDL